MPLVRVELRNEYGLGAPEMYREANQEKPKEILDGVSVAALVGILRQLGDLTDFAAEVFHGLQEEMASTSSRSRELRNRAKRVEAAISPIEKVVLAQRSHLHFAYTPGSNRHACIKWGESKLVFSNAPRFVLDSYEDCRDPPRLDLLDRFDPGGPGSCLKRYSDPSFVKRASRVRDEVSGGKGLPDKRGSRIEKQRSWPRNGGLSRIVSYFKCSGSTQAPSQTRASCDYSLTSDSDERLDLDLSNRSGCVEGDLNPTYSIQPIKEESAEFVSSPMKMLNCNFQDCNLHESSAANACDCISSNLTQKQGDCSSYPITSDQKAAKHEPHNNSDHMHLESFPTELNQEAPANCNAVNLGTVQDVQTCSQALPIFRSSDIASENDMFMDSHSAVDVEFEFNFNVNCIRKQEMLLPDDIDSVSLADKCMQSDQSAGESCNLQRSGSPGNGNISGGTSAVSSGLMNNKLLLPVIRDARGSSEYQKTELEISNVSPVSFWTNGDMLGLEPSKPLDCSGLSQSPAFNTDSTVYKENEESYLPFRKISCKLSPSDLEVKLGGTGNLLHQNNTRSARGSSAQSSFTGREHLENSGNPSKEKLFHGKNENSMHTSCESASTSGQIIDPFGSTLPLPSPSSSPPLVQMKISLQPIDGYANSRLKLKFPCGIGNGEVREIFPSFQLVPEVLPCRQTGGPDSDDNTLYRSSLPSLSNDSPSHQSGTNSEQWESGESPHSKDPDLFDLQSFNTPDDSFVIMPDLPPVPSVQWQITKSHSEDFNYTFDSNDSLSTISQQPKPAPFYHENTTFEQERKHLILQNSDDRRAANKGKNMDDKDDFLHLIRSKSFNLRPTATAKPEALSGSSGNGNVTTILQKANSIRQAVGNDDTDDDSNWSDT